MNKFNLKKLYIKQLYTATAIAVSAVVTVRNRCLFGFDALRQPVGFGLLVV